MAAKNWDSQSFWTDGVNMWSYGTCIATPHPDKLRTVIVNTTKYSTTTSRKQKELLDGYNQQGISVVIVAGVRKGARPDDLVSDYSFANSQ